MLNSISTLVLSIGIAIAVSIYRRNPLDIVVPLAGMHFIFYFFPYFDYTSDEPSLFYPYFLYFGLIVSKESAELYLLYASTLFTLFLASSWYLGKPASSGINKIHVSNKISKKVFFLIFLLFLVLIAYAKFGGSIVYFFTPARKELPLSGYHRKLLFIVPCIVAFLHLHTKRSTLGFFIFILSMVPVVSILGQRREIVVFLMFSSMVHFRSRLENRRIIKSFYIMAVSSVAIVIPGTWYLRVYFTQMLRGGVEVNPLTLRSPVELIFGSSTTGFESIFIQLKHWSLGNIEFAHSLILLLSAPIPRSIWPEKISSIPQTIKWYERDTGNISSFFLNEFMFNFGFPASYVFIIIFAIFLQKLSSLRSSGPLKDVVFLFSFSNSILLFKNGWGDYILTVGLFSVIVYLTLRWRFKF